MSEVNIKKELENLDRSDFTKVCEISLFPIFEMALFFGMIYLFGDK
jgi:hypothetical protein